MDGQRRELLGIGATRGGMNAREREVPPAVGSGVKRGKADTKAADAKNRGGIDGLTASMDAISDSAFGYEQARHLLWRAGFGGTPEQVRTVAGWGVEKAVEYLVDFEKVEYEAVREDAFDRDIMRPPSQDERLMYRRAQATSDEDTLAAVRVRRQEAERDDRKQIQRMQQWWLKRMIETPRPMEEKLTLFWHGHFATSYRTIEDSYHMFQQNQLFRKHAAGNFGELLGAIIRDPAMLKYLDNDESKKGKPNENLAREIMELFSLGVGAYTEQDIKEGARALTGYTFEDDAFVFKADNHDAGSKRLLGRSGKCDGDDFVRIILEQPACSRFIAGKLYRFFAADHPTGVAERDGVSEKVVKDLSDALRRSRYELKPVLKRLLMSEHFYSPALMHEQIKSPVQLVVGAVRSLLTPVRSLGLLGEALNMMGQNILFPPSVKGWDGGRGWINTSTLFVRQNILCFLLTGRTPAGYELSVDETKYDPTALLADLSAADAEAAADPERVCAYVSRFALGRSDPAALGELREFLRSTGDRVNGDTLTGLLLLVTSMPEYQLC